MKKLCSISFIILALFGLVSCVKDSIEDDYNLQPTVIHTPQPYESTEGSIEISYSLDKGSVWQTSDDRLTEFDTWDVKYNEEISGMVFFYATSYEQLLENVEKYGTTTFYSYEYSDDVDWIEFINTYNEAYFEDNILLFYYKYESTLAENYVYNVIIKDNFLVLNINRFGSGWMMISSWHHVVTLKKEDVQDITEFNVSVRTVSELQSSVIFFSNSDYLYTHDISISSFPGVDNIKSVELWTSNIMIDIHFNETITNERLNNIITVLEKSENIKTIGYTDNEWIRVRIDNKFYNSYKSGSLTLDDILDNTIEYSGKFTMEIHDFTPIAIITLEMELHGKEYGEAMTMQLRELNLPFISYDDYPLAD
jgi:hypothetical protein